MCVSSMHKCACDSACTLVIRGSTSRKLKLLMNNDTVNGVIDSHAILFRVAKYNNIGMNFGSVLMTLSFLDEDIKFFSNPASIST